MTKKTRNRLIIIAVAVILAVVVVYRISRRDIAPPDVSDLMVEYHPIADDKNAFIYLHEACEEWQRFENSTTLPYEIVGHTVPVDQYNPEEMEKLIAANSRVLELFDKAMELERLQFPEVINQYQRLRYLSSLRRIGAHQINRALHIFRNGDEKKAFDLLIDIARFGSMIEKGEGILIHFVIGQDIKRSALQRFRELLSETDLDPEHLTTYIGQLRDFHEDGTAVVRSLKAQFKICAKLIDDLYNNRVPKSEAIHYAPPRKSRFIPYSFRPNKTKLIVANAFRTCIANIHRSHTDYQTYEYPLPSERNLFGETIFMGDNWVGKLLCYDLSPTLHETFAFRRKWQTLSLNATQLLITLKCYKLDHGDLPETLDQLVPDYIDAIPIDDFDGKPLRYSKEKKIIYSIGSDMKDNGGPTKSRIEKRRNYPGRFWNHKDPWIRIDF